MLCDSTPSPTPHVLAYNIADFDDYIQFLNASTTLSAPSSLLSSVASSPLDLIIGSCNEVILHGAYDRGNRPSLALFSYNEVLLAPLFSILITLQISFSTHLQLSNARTRIFMFWCRYRFRSFTCLHMNTPHSSFQL